MRKGKKWHNISFRCTLTLNSAFLCYYTLLIMRCAGFDWFTPYLLFGLVPPGRPWAVCPIVTNITSFSSLLSANWENYWGPCWFQIQLGFLAKGRRSVWALTAEAGLGDAYLRVPASSQMQYHQQSRVQGVGGEDKKLSLGNEEGIKCEV